MDEPAIREALHPAITGKAGQRSFARIPPEALRGGWECSAPPVGLRITALICHQCRRGSSRWTASLSIPAWCAGAVSYTHLRAHETGRNLVCRLLLEKKKKKKTK